MNTIKYIKVSLCPALKSLVIWDTALSHSHDIVPEEWYQRFMEFSTVSYYVLEKNTALNMSCSPESCFPCERTVYHALGASWNPFFGCIPFIPSIFPLPWLLNESVLTLGFCFQPSFPVWLVGAGCRCWFLLSSHSSALSFSAFYSHLWAYYASKSLCWSHSLSAGSVVPRCLSLNL